MSFKDERLAEITGDLLTIAARQGLFYTPTVESTRARMRILGIEPFQHRNYDICNDAPRLAGACAIGGFFNEVTWATGDEYLPTAMVLDRGYLYGIKATPEMVQGAEDFVISHMGLAVPVPLAKSA